MKKRVILSIMLAGILLAFAVVAFVAVGNSTYRWEPPEQGKYERTIRVVSDAYYAPISFYDKNGNPAGHDVELIYAVGEKLGVNIELDLLEWPEATKRFRAGEYDLLLKAVYAQERTNWLEYTTPVLNQSYVVFGRDAKDFLVAELSGAKIALMAGDAVKDAIFATYEVDENLRYHTTYAKCFEQLAAGKCDYVIAPKAVGQIILREMGMEGIEASNTVVYNSVYCFAVQPGNSALAEEVNGALRDLSLAGDVNELYQYWMQDYADGMTFLNELGKHWPLLVSLFLIVGFIFTFQVLYFEINRSRTQKKAAAILQRERMLYRDALLHDCEYAFSFDLNEGIVHGLQKSAPGHASLMEFPISYEKMLARLRDVVRPDYLLGSLEEQYPENLVAAYESGKRLLEIECFMPQSGLYQRKNIFLSKDEESGHIMVCVVNRNITAIRKEELETKRAVSQLANAAEQITHGNLDVEIDSKLEGDIGVLANVFQMTVAVLKQRLKNASNAALADTLTGVGNRTAYDLRMKEYDAKLETACDVEFSVVMVDLNGLKQINDNLGHDMGDKYIVTAVELLKKTFGDVVIYRVGGDEFVMIIDYADREQIETLLRKLKQNLNEYNQTHTIFPNGLGVAVGTAIYDPETDRRFKDVFARADAFMYEDKRKNKNRECR